VSYSSLAVKDSIDSLLFVCRKKP